MKTDIHICSEKLQLFYEITKVKNRAKQGAISAHCFLTFTFILYIF